MKKNYYAKALALTVAASMVSVPAFAAEENDAATLQADAEGGIATLPMLDEVQPVVVAEQEEEPVAEPTAQVTTGGGNKPVAFEAETEKTIPEAGGNLESGTYKLTEDVTLTDANLTVPADAEVTIDLNGKTLTGNGSGSVIRVSGKLTILDSGKGGKITGGFKKYIGTWVNNVAHDGGGIFVDADAEVVLESGSITGNDAWNGGGVYVNGGGSFTMNGGEISDNNALRPYHGGGGGIYVLNDEKKENGIGKFVMNGGVIKGNTTLTQGGGAFIDGVMEMNGGEIIDNTGLKGGGVCINGTMTLNDGVVSHNKAEFLEGTEYNGIECGGIKINSGTLNLNGGEITDNTATSTEKINAKGEDVEDAVAAGIYNVGTLNVSGAPIVSGNTTDGKAQNIYLNSGRVITLSGDLDAAAKLYTTLDSETGRATDTDGHTVPEGVILPDNEALTVETHKGDIYFFKDVPVENAVCSTWVDDTKVYHESLAAAMASLPSDDNVVTLLKNCALTSQVGVTTGVEATLTSENPVSITWEDADRAFFYINENATLSLQGPITVQGNYTDMGNEISENTALFAFDVRGTLNIGERGTADDASPVVQNFNTVTVNSSNQPNGGYGAIQVNGGTVNLYSGILRDNVAWYGGAIYATGSGAAVNLVGGEVTGNYARYGGGVGATDQVEVELSGSTIDKNYTYRKLAECALCSSAGGAGIYVATNSTFNMTGGVVKENIATDGVGGGIYLGNYTTGTMTGGSVIDNKATTSNATDATKWVSNEARGAGIFISYATAFTMEDGLVSGNQLVDENGKNTSVSGGGVVVSGTKTQSGENLYAIFNMNGGTISENSSTKTGGGVYITGPTKVTLSGGKITENVANTGGGVYVADSSNGGEELHLKGSPYIANNNVSDVLLSGKTTKKGEDGTTILVYPERVITIDSALKSGAHIGVLRSNSTTNVIAKAADGYTIADNDAAYFTYSNSNKLIQLDTENNQLVLADKGNETYHNVTLTLDHVTADKALTTQVKGSETYEVTFTPENGYEIETVKVGEEDKTQALENGKLILTNITADTTITVTAKEKNVTVTPETKTMNFVYGQYGEDTLGAEIAFYAANDNVKSYALAEGSVLPAGLTLNENGEVYGTPTEVVTEGKTVQVVVTATNGKTETIELTVVVEKAPQRTPAKQLTAASVSRTSITLNELPENMNGAKAEYSIDGEHWQEGLVFDGLRANTTYTIYARYAETDEYNASDAITAEFRTRKKSSSSSDTSAPTYGVSTGKTENGAISVTPAKAEAGEKVTIKATPDSGYQLDKVTVKDKNNSTVKLTKVNDNEYTFTMPSGKVSVDATFVQKDATDDNQNNAGETSKVIKLQIGSRIVTVDNEAVIYDVAPVIRNDRTLVPIRIVTETLGGKVDWNGVTKEVTLTIDGKEIKMTVGKTLEKYGVAPVIIDGRTFVPVRFVADELGATVAWDDATKTVTITKIEK